MMKIITDGDTMGREFKRKELYDLVWSEPLRTLAKNLDISDVRLGKICRRANIPLPGLGYWAKQAAGKATPQPPLPPRAPGQRDEVTFGGHYLSCAWMSDEEVTQIQHPPPPSFPESLADITIYARRMIGKFRKTTFLKQPHPLIAKLLAVDEQRRQKMLESTWHWDTPIFDNPIEQRRLRIINRLFWTFSRCQCRPEVVGKDAGSFAVTVSNERVSFTLDPPGTERNNSQRRPGHTSKEQRLLQLKLSWHEPPTDIAVSWIDCDNSLLEDQLTDIAVGLIVAGEWSYRRKLICHHAWLVERKQELLEKARRQEAQRQRREREKLLELEQARRNKLIMETAAWQQASEVRKFVSAVMNTAQSSNANSTNASLTEWATWALAEADRLDPLQQPLEQLLVVGMLSNDRL